MLAKRLPISKKTRFEVFMRDDFRCRYCGRRVPDVTLQVDHVFPVASGGTNEISNLATSCMECNSGKSDQLLDGGTALAEPPVRARLSYLQDLVINRFPSAPSTKVSWLLEQGLMAGMSMDKLEALAIGASTWPTICGRIYGYLQRNV